MYKTLKSFQADFNWVNGKVAPANAFTKVDAKTYVDWHYNLGCNNMWTFATTYNGYAWYDSKIAPKAIGLQYDFMSKTVELAKLKGLEIFAYMCLGDNPYLIEKNSSIARVDEELFRLPFTNWYLEYFCSVLDEVLDTAPIDGMVFDWFRTVQNKRTTWIDDEKQLYKELIGEKFSSTFPSDEMILNYERLALENAWKKISNTVKNKGKKIKIWTNQPFEIIEDPIWQDHILLKEVDYLLNECPNFGLLKWIKSQVGPNTTVVQNLCGWKEHDLTKLNTISKDDYGFFGFAQADLLTCLPSYEVSPINFNNINVIKDFYMEF